MAELDLYWMLVLLFSPLVFAIVCWVSNWKTPQATSWYAVFGASLVLGLNFAVISQFKYDTIDQLGILDDDLFRSRASLFERAKVADLNPDFEVHSSFDWVTKIRWVSKYGVQFYLGLDGLSLGFMLFSNIAFFLGMLSGWMKENTSFCQYPWLFMAQYGLVGSFLSLDVFFILFFLVIFLVSTYFLSLKMFGGVERRYAAAGFQIASLGIALVAMVLLYCTQSEMKRFGNPDEIKAAVQQMKRNHPEMDVAKIDGIISSHSWNLMAYQRVGILSLKNPDLMGKEITGAWRSKSIQKTCFILILLAGLALILANYLFLAGMDYSNTAYSSAYHCFSMVFGLLGFYMITRLGVSLFPLGVKGLSNALVWIFYGLTLLSTLGLFVCRPVWRLPARFVPWAYMVVLAGLFSVMKLPADVWNSKVFAGLFFWVFSISVAIPMITGLFVKIRDLVKVDLFETPLGLWKTNPGMMILLGLTFLVCLGVPATLGFLGIYSAFGSILSAVGLVPFVAMMVSVLLVVRAFLRALEGFCAGNPLSEGKSLFTLHEKLSFLAGFVLLIGTGAFPNLVLSWYYPSTSAIYDLIQLPLGK